MENLNLKSIAYQFAGHLQSEKNLARRTIELYPNFDESIEAEVKAEFYEGSQLRYAENHPEVEKTYILRNRDGVKTYEVMAENEKPAKDAELIKLSVSFVMSESQQKFSSLKDSNPALHSLCSPIRTAVNKYCSNNLKALQRKVKELKNEGKQRTRSATKSFAEVVTDVMMDLKKKCKAAQARGDESANDKLLGQATVEFMTVWNHK